MKKKICLLLLSFAMPLFLIAQPLTSPDFTKGYLYSKLENQFPRACIQLDVVNNDVIVYDWPLNLPAQNIQGYLGMFCPGYRIEFNPAYQPNYSSQPSFQNADNSTPNEPIEEGSILPELNPFFPTMLAQPHILGYSAGYRSYDLVFKSTLPVSIGDQFSFYQFKLNSGAGLYVGLEACVWAIFEAKTKSLSLINADYFVSIPLTYVKDKFSARLRIFHQSSHLGDEFLLEHPKIKRVNPSMEGVNLSLAYTPIEGLEGFIGYTRIIRSDDSFKVKPNCLFYGFNYFLKFAKIKIFNAEALPYVAVFFRNNENNDWKLDSSVAIGYQLNKSYGRKLRVYVEGHQGFSEEGQYARRKSKYVSLNLSYGY